MKQRLVLHDNIQSSVSVITNTVISFVVEISVQKQVSVIGVEAAVKPGMEHVPIF